MEFSSSKQRRIRPTHRLPMQIPRPGNGRKEARVCRSSEERTGRNHATNNPQTGARECRRRAPGNITGVSRKDGEAGFEGLRTIPRNQWLGCSSGPSGKSNYLNVAGSNRMRLSRRSCCGQRSERGRPSGPSITRVKIALPRQSLRNSHLTIDIKQAFNERRFKQRTSLRAALNRLSPEIPIVVNTGFFSSIEWRKSIPSRASPASVGVCKGEVRLMQSPAGVQRSTAAENKNKNRTCRTAVRVPATCLRKDSRGSRGKTG
jgi:hypothetical protein